MESSAVTMALGTGPVVKTILIILVLCSVASWTIIFSKWMAFRKARSESDRFLDIFWNSKSLESIYAESKSLPLSPLSGVFRAGYMELRKLGEKKQEGSYSPSMSEIMAVGIENIQRSLRKAYLNEAHKLESLVPYLATIASVAPFIGLFGTVWGIMDSFHGLGQGGPATLQRVAPGISEALIATAVGLGAAIPAAVAYNQYVLKIKNFRSEMESFSADFTNIIRRNYLG